MLTMMFQFPSNGKVFPNWEDMRPLKRGRTVSIPFKREGLSEQELQEEYEVKVSFVSIPFKREGLSEPRMVLIRLGACSGFNSLQTGRSFRTNIIHLSMLHEYQGFQFPSNGKVFPNTNFRLTSAKLVSHGFNSLQTGRSFRTFRITYVQDTRIIKFQFPSNGKVFPNTS